MKYLKLFDTESDYKAYRDGVVGRGGYIKPNVSLCDDNGNVYYNYSPFNGYDYVDLDLSSGTLWATCNVGASKPSDYGQYFQWGDTSGYTANQVGTGEGQKKFASDWSDYKWYLSGSNDNPNRLKFTKYTITSVPLELEDDAAHANMGGSWHMPTPEQIQELIDETTREWTTSDEVSGMTFTSKIYDSKSIFIPAAGYATDGSVQGSGTEANVWLSMLYPGCAYYGKYLYLTSDIADYYSGVYRYFGLSVRGVVG